MIPPLDLLAIGAHPDDCELFAGGLLGAYSERGASVIVCDLTRGEAASRGTPDERQAASWRAAEILKLTERLCLDLGDGRFGVGAAEQRAVVELLRRYRPRAVLTHHPRDRHPDHTHAHQLVREACYYATVGGFDAEGERLEREPRLFYFFGNAPLNAFQVDFIFPLTAEQYARRQQALAQYQSQFYPGESDAEKEGAAVPAASTLMASREYAEFMEARYKFFGGLVGAPYGEPYQWEKTPALRDPLGI